MCLLPRSPAWTAALISFRMDTLFNVILSPDSLLSDKSRLILSLLKYAEYTRSIAAINIQINFIS